MYQPPHFREDRREVLHALMRSHPLACLVTVGAGGLDADHIPVLLDADRGPHGVLRAHVARGNDILTRHDPAREVLAIFGGAQAYVTPNWYATKAETHRVVPTWNYAVVHARGRLSVVDDAAWVRRQIGDLTALRETLRMDATGAAPWAVEDAPPAFVEAQLRAIVGIEIAITAIEGKWKVSQNRTTADRAGVAAGLRGDGDPQDMAGLVEAFAPRG